MKLYSKKNYTKLFIFPIILLIVSLLLIFLYPGVSKGIDLKGGNQIIVYYGEEKDYSPLENSLKQDSGINQVQISEVKGLNSYGLLIEFSLQKDIENAKLTRSKMNFTKNLDTLKSESRELLIPLVDKNFLTEEDISFIQSSRNTEDLRQGLAETLSLANYNFYNYITSLVKTELNLPEDTPIQTREIAPTLGKDFVKSSVKVGIVAFTLLIIVVLLFFRQIIPSALIIFAVILDVFAALVGMALFNIPLSLTTIPALLMLIGYSVDTDILLTTRVLKDPSQDPFKAANSSVATGLTMTFTTISTIVVMLLISHFTHMLIIFEISIILLGGLIGDIISTWLFNAPALIKYAEKHKKQM